MPTIIIIIVVLVLMTAVIFFILKNTVANINEQGRVYFTLKLQQYDKNENESEAVEENEKGLKEKEEVNTETNQAPNQGTIVFHENKHDYEVDDLLEIVKKIDTKFSFNREEVIRKFLKEKVDTDGIKKYTKLKEVRDFILKIGVYNIITSNDAEFIDKVEKAIDTIDHKIYTRYIQEKDEFEIEDFLNYLEYEIGTCDPTVYVLVGDRKEDYNYIDKRIKTMYNDKVYRGIKIIYKNKMYDFSLS